MTQQLTGDSAPASALPSCAVVSRLLGGSPGGTATLMRSWLLIEHPGPWPADVLEQVLDEAFPGERRAELERLQQSHGLRPLLIRGPGRHHRELAAERRTVLVGGASPSRWLEELEIGDLRELAALDLEAVASGRGGVGTPVSGPVFLVCTHGTKDLCCATLGRPVAAALQVNHPGSTWETSHVGGDRWAGNLLVVPDGFLHGHLTPDEADRVAKAARAGQVCPELLRGRTTVASPWAQYAEIAARRHTGLRGLDDVLALEERPAEPDEPLQGNGARPQDGSGVRVVTVRAGGNLLRVTVRRQPAASHGRSRCSELVALETFTADVSA